MLPEAFQKARVKYGLIVRFELEWGQRRKIMDRFNLEGAIMECWNTKDDLLLVWEGVEKEGFDPDRTVNAVVGLSEIHDLRCKRLWEAFEGMVDGDLIDLEDSDLEDKIMACWAAKEDMDLISEGIIEYGRDAAALKGLSELHDMRCERLFSTFEMMVGEGSIR